MDRTVASLAADADDKSPSSSGSYGDFLRMLDTHANAQTACERGQVRGKTTEEKPLTGLSDAASAKSDDAYNEFLKFLQSSGPNYSKDAQKAPEGSGGTEDVPTRDLIPHEQTVASTEDDENHKHSSVSKPFNKSNTNEFEAFEEAKPRVNDLTPPVSNIYTSSCEDDWVTSKHSLSDADSIGRISHLQHQHHFEQSPANSEGTYSDLPEEESVHEESLRPPIAPTRSIGSGFAYSKSRISWLFKENSVEIFVRAVAISLLFHISQKSLKSVDEQSVGSTFISVSLLSLIYYVCQLTFDSGVANRSRDSVFQVQAPIMPTPFSNRSKVYDSRNSSRMSLKKRGEGYGPPLDNISQTVGNTPLVKISDRLCPPGRTIYAKCEFFNPLSSVKDRMALSIIETAEKNGTLRPGQTVIEATSGNTGIAVAMMCAQRGYPCVITMAESFSLERRKLMRMLGARVVLTPKAGKGTGMVEKARELAEKHGWFLCHQFETDANWKFHYETTGPEICNDLKGMKFDYWVTGYGTGGTFHGAGKYIKKHRPETKIVLAELEAANMVNSGIPTERRADGSPAVSHPAFGPHPVQGWAPDFIALVLEKGLNQGIHDDIVEIPDGAAVRTAVALAREEGILTGISGGASMWAAIKTAMNAPEGSVIVTMLPDTGERYLSTPLFARIFDEMNEEELAIARSTPSWILNP